MLTRRPRIQLVFGQKIARRGGSNGLIPIQKPSESTAPASLLHLDRCSCLSELLLDGLGFVLGNALFNRLRSTVDQVLGFFQAKARDLAYRLDHIDLI